MLYTMLTVSHSFMTADHIPIDKRSPIQFHSHFHKDVHSSSGICINSLQHYTTVDR